VSFKEITNRMFINFFVIFFLIMLVICVPLWFLGIEEIGLDMVFLNMALAFLTVLSELVFYSKRELSKTQFLVRHLICLTLVMAIALGFMIIVDGASFSQPINIAIIVGSVSIIYTLSAAIDFLRATKSTNKLMEKLNERYK